MTITTSKIPRIAITPGEPAGIGPDLIVQIAKQAHMVELVAIADPQLLQTRAQQLGIALKLIPCNLSQLADLHPAGSLKIIPIPVAKPVVPGVVNLANAHYVLKTLQVAGEGCMHQQFDAVVTGPVHKGIINDAGIPFSGHTEFFAELTQTQKVVMMLAAADLRVALVTRHLPLAEVPKALTATLLEQTLTIVHTVLKQRFRIPQPRILVCGLNPHAGEGGHLGREEIDVINPVIAQLAKQMDVKGPFPADTIFTPPFLKQADVIVAMYHDQGLPVLKHYGFGQAVNVSLGLPIIRTSVDHGTALALAGTGQADSGSLLAAIQMATELVCI